MQKVSVEASATSNYRVKSIQPVVIGSHLQARLFTLAPGDTIPWHYHKESTDHYFVLEGTLTVFTREPEEMQTFGVGTDYKIAPGTAHLIANDSTVDCRFLLLQGVGRYDWVKVDD